VGTPPVRGSPSRSGSISSSQVKVLDRRELHMSHEGPTAAPAPLSLRRAAKQANLSMEEFRSAADAFNDTPGDLRSEKSRVPVRYDPVRLARWLQDRQEDPRTKAPVRVIASWSGRQWLLEAPNHGVDPSHHPNQRPDSTNWLASVSVPSIQLRGRSASPPGRAEPPPLPQQPHPVLPPWQARIFPGPGYWPVI
jgi:hypothetical protein